MDWFAIATGLLGGLALFLFGLDQLAKGLQAVAGKSMKILLSRFTRNRLIAAASGALITAVLNSSSVTTVLVVGFISAGLLGLAQAIGVIMGANIGSTFTAQIVAFDVNRYALALIGAGFVMFFAAKRKQVRQWGGMVMGLGLVFFGMGVMGDAMTPLRSYQPFIDLMARMEGPLVGLLAGLVFTALVQSSAATIGIVIVMATAGLITLPGGIALALGANIGTCVTAVIASVGKSREAQRAAAAHVLFNVAGAAIWLLFIDRLAGMAVRVSPAHPELEGAARLAAEVPRQVANANSLFNLINTALFLPFAGAFAVVVTRLLPDRPQDERRLVRPKFLEPGLLGHPSLALEHVRLELGHLGELVLEMWSSAAAALPRRDADLLDEVAAMDDRVDSLHDKVVEYMGGIRQSELTRAESSQFLGLLSACNYLETIGDVVATDLVTLGQTMIDKELQPSETIRLALSGLADVVKQAITRALRAVVEDDPTASQEVLAAKGEVARQVDRVLRHQASKLVPDDATRLAVFRLEMGVVESLKRAYTLAKRLAKLTLSVDSAGDPEEMPEAE